MSVISMLFFYKISEFFVSDFHNFYSEAEINFSLIIQNSESAIEQMSDKHRVEKRGVEEKRGKVAVHQEKVQRRLSKEKLRGFKLD